MLEIQHFCIFCETEKPTREFYDDDYLHNRCKECKRKARGASDQERMWARAKQRAYDKKLPFDIEPGDIVIPTHCPILGNKLSAPRSMRRNQGPSLDRVVPDRGYVKGNIQVISFRANRIKNDGTPAEHDKIAEWTRLQMSTVQA